MSVSHVAGGGVGALLGALIAGVLSRYTSLHVSDVDAAVIGSAALSAGIGIAHALSTFGLSGIARRIWRGAPAKVLVTPPPLPPEIKA